MQIRSQKWVLALSLVLLGATASFAAGPDKDAYVDQIDDATIVQSQGVDQRVDYVALRRFGPWDDRNYALTQADVAVLPANDEYRYGVPAFFKILKRKESIQEGFPIHEHYPRELDKEFDLRFGGLLQDGVLHRRGLGIYSHPDPANPPENLIYATDPLPHAVPINGENFMAIGDEETSIKYNPVDPLKIIAGSNSPSGGQAQNYSLDGGATWLSGGNLPSTCCDPAMEWSADGTIAYAATLTSVGGSFRAAVFRSINNGQTWAGRVDVSTASSDKEYIHVDKSSTSPFLENVYLTWHQGNVMFFSRSLDKGLTWSTPISFSSAPLGIGSDITTDKMGNIYYIWPSSSTSTKNVYMVKSTDGGATFAAPVVVQPLFDVYDFPIPAMETRNAFIYIAADTDRSTGPHAGRVYAAYTAMHPSSGNAGAATNHAWIQVAFSDNGGATWALATTPHSVADIATIDRFHPWLEVDGQGAVHIGFYDTRNSVNRTGIDFYYNYSIDGGTTWLDETRVSSVTSPNITNGQEWGDYNGLSVGPVSAAMSWSDNRGSVQHSYVGRVQNLAAGPTYTLNSTSPATVGVCAGQPVPPRVLSLTGYSGYTGPVAISFPGLNATVFPSATATPNPVNVSASAATSTVNLTTSPSAPPGVYPVTVQSTGGGSPAVVRQLGFSVNLASAAPSIATLTTPANAAINVPTNPTLSWTASTQAASYNVQVASDAAFANVVFSGSVSAATSIMVTTGLATSKTYYWRVTSQNACGTSAQSAVFSFTTMPAPGDCSAGTSARNVFTEDFTNGAGGFTTTGGNGTSWALSMARPSPASGGNAMKSAANTTASNQLLTSPTIALPTGQQPLTLAFNRWRFLEINGTTACYDGGFLEASVNGGAFTAIPGSNILNDPYTGPLGSGQPAWCSSAAVDYSALSTFVDLSAWAGSSVQLRWRVVTDSSVAREGWYVDDVRVQVCSSDLIFKNGFDTPTP